MAMRNFTQIFLFLLQPTRLLPDLTNSNMADVVQATCFANHLQAHAVPLFVMGCVFFNLFCFLCCVFCYVRLLSVSCAHYCLYHLVAPSVFLNFIYIPHTTSARSFRRGYTIEWIKQVRANFCTAQLLWGICNSIDLLRLLDYIPFYKISQFNKYIISNTPSLYFNLYIKAKQLALYSY